MADLADGESVEIKGSARDPYLVKNVGGVYSCTCPAWRNQSVAIERRTCKHIRAYRGEAAEKERLGSLAPVAAPPAEGEAATDKSPPLLLAQTWENDVDLTGWWLSEKLDGVRAYWDGKQFLSRQGNKFHAPDWFVESLPEQPLDGELWLDRKAFQRTVSIVRRQDKSEHWRQIRYLVFDLPSVAAPFEARVQQLRDCLAARPSAFVSAHEHFACRGVDHLREELSRVEALGGEGLMLREPGSRYEAGRSSTLLKVKTFRDAEATVVEHLPGAGRHAGRLGALLVTFADGKQFSVGTGLSDAQRENPPPPGSTITFRYQELSDRGIPRFPSFVRVRQEALAPPARSERAAETSKPKIGTQAAPQATGAQVRRFEFADDKSSKFWEILMAGNDVTVRFGRIGTNGQTQTKNFAAAAAAQKHAENLISEKTEKGYAEVSAK